MPWMPRQWRSELCTVPRRSFARRSEAKPIPENYKILGVHFDASPKEIKIGFLEQVKLNHPDVSSEPDAAEKFDKIQVAYNTLIDAETRKEYDISTIGAQQDWVYGEDSDAVQVPDDEEGMTAMILDIDARIKRTQANIEAASLTGSLKQSLEEELAGLRESRAHVRAERTKLRQASMKRGGGRAKARQRRFKAGSEWWDVPDNPTHNERMHGGGRRNRPTKWDPYLRGEESTVAEKKFRRNRQDNHVNCEKETS